MSLPENGIQFVLFLLVRHVKSVFVVSFSMLIYISAFYTLSPVGMRHYCIGTGRLPGRSHDTAAVFSSAISRYFRVSALCVYAEYAAAHLHRAYCGA